MRAIIIILTLFVMLIQAFLSFVQMGGKEIAPGQITVEERTVAPTKTGLEDSPDSTPTPEPTPAPTNTPTIAPTNTPTNTPTNAPTHTPPATQAEEPREYDDYAGEEDVL